jgi:dienelactone hydrolase
MRAPGNGAVFVGSKGYRATTSRGEGVWWTIRRNNAVVLKEGKLDLSSGKDKIEITGDQPEMIYAAIEPYAPTAAPSGYAGGNTGRNNGLYAVGAAVAPAKIGLSTPCPQDFDAFWDGKLAAQAKIPINPVLTPVETDVPGVELSVFVLDALGSKAHCYFARPARAGKFPARIQLQYASVYALNARGAAQRAAEGWLFINVDSHDQLPSDPSGGVPRNYQAIGNTDREKSYFLNMYLRDSRVLDYLLTRPDWDGKTIVLTGDSMGGQQSLVLAGLQPDKISAVLVCVPPGADSNGDLHQFLPIAAGSWGEAGAVDFARHMAVGRHDHDRLDLSVGQKIVHDHVGAPGPGPRRLDWSVAVQQIQDRVLLLARLVAWGRVHVDDTLGIQVLGVIELPVDRPLWHAPYFDYGLLSARHDEQADRPPTAHFQIGIRRVRHAESTVNGVPVSVEAGSQRSHGQVQAPFWSL